MLVDRNTGEEHTPLKYLDEDQARFFVHDSLLSEFAAMGFEYGYSVENPNALVCWEAQFGDFVNGAQSIIDEFISSGEVKWGQRSRVTLLLPHGHEGQGPDHTSARIERFLQLCAEDNMTVANCTTPANYFHLLRRQALGAAAPLVVFTPKSLLRLRAAISPVEDFTDGRFQPVLRRPGAAGRVRGDKVLLCSGKVYYDLAAGGPSATSPTPRSCGWSSSTRSRSTRCARRWPRTRRPRSAGSRRSRPTRAPGRSWRCGCWRCWTAGRR